MNREVAYLSLVEVSRRIRRRDLTAVGVLEALFARIKRLEPRLASFTTVMADPALAAARRADAEIEAGFWRGPLHGAPIGVKDLIDIAGQPTGCGGEVMRDRIADADATVVRRLIDAGAVIVGKLHMTEGATYDHHPSLRRPDNPWREGHWTGVSSSGSGVAVAAGLCYGALGTDTGGSVRMPAAACGVSGLKPTWGRVSRHGLFPLAESLDHIGPMARSVQDAAVLLQVIAGADPADLTSLTAAVPDYAAELGSASLAGRVFGIDRRQALGLVEPAVCDALEGVLELLQDAGAQVRDVRLPDLAQLALDLRTLSLAEMAVAHAERFPARADRYGPRLRTMLELGGGVRGVDVARAIAARDRFCGALARVFAEVDLLVFPTLPWPAPAWSELESPSGELAPKLQTATRFTSPFNAARVPALSIPMGFDPDGLPLGLQIVGPHLSEARVLAAGHAYQQRTAFHTARPPLA